MRARHQTEGDPIRKVTQGRVRDRNESTHVVRPLNDPRLARHRRDRFGYQCKRAVRDPLQQTAAHGAGLDPTLMVAANTSGGVVGKMISPQNLTIAATAVGLLGRESDILRKVILWSLGLLAAMCLLVGLQSTPVLSWMLP